MSSRKKIFLQKVFKDFLLTKACGEYMEEQFKKIAVDNIDFLKGILQNENENYNNVIFGNSVDGRIIMIAVYDHRLTEEIYQDKRFSSLIRTIEQENGQSFIDVYNTGGFDKRVKKHQIGINFNTEKSLKDFIECIL